jgi:hypothetical protein
LYSEYNKCRSKWKETNEWEELKYHLDCPSSFGEFLNVKQSKMMLLKSNVLTATAAAASMMHIMGKGKMRRGRKYSCFKSDRFATVHY